MKKTYMKPEIDPVVMQHTNIICGSITRINGDGGGDTGIGYGGKSEENEEFLVKDHNVWNDEW